MSPSGKLPYPGDSGGFCICPPRTPPLGNSWSRLQGCWTILGPIERRGSPWEGPGGPCWDEQEQAGAELLSTFGSDSRPRVLPSQRIWFLGARWFESKLRDSTYSMKSSPRGPVHSTQLEKVREGVGRVSEMSLIGKGRGTDTILS